MILATRHTGLVVKDLDISLKFYRDLLGLKVWKRQVESGPFPDALVGISGVRLEWVKLEIPDGTLLELLQYHSHPPNNTIINTPSNQHGCSHVAFKVDNLEKKYRLLCDNGYHCVSVPLVSPDGKVKVLYCHDPDGIILELVEELPSSLR
jgi:catechol 2,3-dioxygenase-like lactoylglutathione lyase family enzyme